MASTPKPKRKLLTLMRMDSESTVTGYEGVALKIIERAAVDYLHPRNEFWRLTAIEFFLSDRYRQWLSLIHI